MEYGNGLKALRQKMLEGATGRQAPEIKSLESFIPSRSQSPMLQEEPEDIMASTAAWLAEIKQASLEAKKTFADNYSADKASSFISGYTNAKRSKRAKEEESTPEERTDSFVARRDKNSPSTYAPQRPSEMPIPVDAEMPQVLDAIAAVESRGSGDYEAVGPVVEKGMYKGQRAYGRYQVMEGNIGPWSEEVFGRRMTKEEFMASPAAQDAIAAYQLQKAKTKHGTWEDAASVWFSGRPMKVAGNASDSYLSTPEYINKFRSNFVRT